jgi:hypothetical protein
MHGHMNPTQTIIVPARTVASRVMGDSALLIHPEADEIKLTNEVGTLVWRLVCERRHTAAAITDAVVAAFDVDAATAGADVASFLEELSRADLIERVDP